MALKEMKKLPVKSNGHKLPFTEVDVAFYEVGGGVFPQVFDSWSRCRECDGGVDRKVVGDAVVVQGEPCQYQDGITSVITLKVPSGKIVVTDDLRPLYDGFNDSRGDFPSYNSTLGQHKVIEAFAAQGCAFGPVGNSCPGLWRTGEGTYEIVTGVWSEDWADEDEEFPANPRKAEDKLTSICTDLWAYSIADYDDWVAKGGKPEDMGWTTTVVDIEPGVYEFTHHTGEKGFDHWADGEIIFAHIRKVG